MTEFTPHLNLPLPHPAGALEQDVLNIRAALSAVDTKFASLDQLLASDDVDLDALQELVNTLKADNSAIQSIFAALATKADAALTHARLQRLEDQQLVGINFF